MLKGHHGVCGERRTRNRQARYRISPLRRQNFTPDVEAAAERIKKTSERVLELSKENGLIWLEAYEKMLDGVLKLEEDTAKDLGSDWVEKLVSTQADFIRNASQAYLSTLKDRLK